MLRLNFLGGFRVTLDDEPVTDFISNKARALLCYLTVKDGSHPRSELATMLWRDMPRRKALTNLRQVIANLRQLVGPHLTINRRTAAFDRGSDYRLDVDEFTTAAVAFQEHADFEAGQRAADLYQGDFLRGFHAGDASAFEEWAAVQRELLHKAALRVLYGLAAHYAERMEYQEALDYLDRLLILEPWREEAHRQRMAFLARLGRRNAALKQYEICRHVLAEELGVSPAAETEALYRRIQEARRTPRHNLPSEGRLSPFVGRDGDLEALARMLARPHRRLVTLVGPGGVGKTRLALQFAARNDHLFLDGVRFASLTAVPSASRLPTVVAQALSISPDKSVSPREHVLDYLEEREVLLILDNFEHLLAQSEPDTSFLSQVLRRAPHVKLLITSRERLKVRGEWVFPLEGLDVQPHSASDAGTPAAVELFSQRARQADGRFALTAENEPHVTRICETLEGNPLGIELVAALTPYRSCAALARQIRRDLDVLRSPLRDAPARHRSMRAVFESSWVLLSAQEQRTLAGLSVFQGGFEAEAAKHVVLAEAPAAESSAAEPSAAESSAALLRALVDKSLLHFHGEGKRNVSPSTVGERYTMHELVRQFAREKLSQRGRLEALRARHGRYYLTFLRDRESDMKGERQEAAIEAIQATIDNVRAAWRWAVETGQAREIGKAAAGLAYFYEIRGWFQEGREVFAAAVDLLQGELRRSEDFRTRLILGQALTRNSLFDGYLGLHQEAINLQWRSVELLRRGGATSELGFALIILGRLLANTGRFSEGVERCQEGLAMLRKTGSRWEIATALNTLGNIFNIQGLRDQAAQHYEEGARGFEAVGDQRGLAVAYTNLGNVAYYRGDFAAAEVWHRKSLALKRTVGDRRGIAVSLHNLGEVAYRRERYPEARGLFEESLAFSRKIDYRLCIAESLNLLGDTAYAQEAYSQARRHYRASLTVSEKTDNVNQIATSLSRLGRASAVLGEIEQARAHFERALQLPVAPPWVPNTLVDLIELFIAQEAYREALEVAALVRVHPASRLEAQGQAEAVIARLRPHLPPEEAEVAIRRGQHCESEQVVRRVQDHLGRK